MINNKLTVGITQGDANGIGYEVIIKALADARILDSFTPVVYGSSKIFGFYRKLIHNLDPMDVYSINSAKDAKFHKINIVNCLPDTVTVEPGQASEESARGAITSLEAAVKDLKDGLVDVLVTAPINKQTMDKVGFGFTGHTEYLQKAFGAKDVLMFMVSDRMRIALVTQHIPIREVPSQITQDKILSKLRLMKASLQRDFCVDDPKIAVLGLNPHCGDGGLLGKEEQEIIIPAVKAAQEEGINAFGPYSPDGFFGLGNYARFDATLAMYHDQGLAPFKTISFADGVNFTAGLPVVRTSPDHGTAFEKAGRDESDPHSMISAIFTAIDIYRNRVAYDRIQAGKMVERELDDRPERGYERGFSERGGSERGYDRGGSERGSYDRNSDRGSYRGSRSDYHADDVTPDRATSSAAASGASSGATAPVAPAAPATSGASASGAAPSSTTASDPKAE